MNKKETVIDTESKQVVAREEGTSRRKEIGEGDYTHIHTNKQTNASVPDDSSGMCLALIVQTVLQEVANTMNHLKPLMKQL